MSHGFLLPLVNAVGDAGTTTRAEGVRPDSTAMTREQITALLDPRLHNPITNAGPRSRFGKPGSPEHSLCKRQIQAIHAAGNSGEVELIPILVLFADYPANPDGKLIVSAGLFSLAGQRRVRPVLNAIAKMRKPGVMQLQALLDAGTGDAHYRARTLDLLNMLTIPEDKLGEYLLRPRAARADSVRGTPAGTTPVPTPVPTPGSLGQPQPVQ